MNEKWLNIVRENTRTFIKILAVLQNSVSYVSSSPSFSSFEINYANFAHTIFSRIKKTDYSHKGMTVGTIFVTLRFALL